MRNPPSSFPRSAFATALGFIVGVDHLSWVELLLVHEDRKIDDDVLTRLVDALEPTTDDSRSKDAPPTAHALAAMYREYFVHYSHQWEPLFHLIQFRFVAVGVHFRDIEPYVMHLQRWTDGSPDFIQEMFFTLALDKARSLDDIGALYRLASTKEQKERALAKMEPVDRLPLKELIGYAEVSTDPRVALERILLRVAEIEDVHDLVNVYRAACRCPDIETRVRSTIRAWIDDTVTISDHVRRLEKILWNPFIVDAPLFAECLQVARDLLADQTGLTFDEVNSLVHGFNGYLNREGRENYPKAPVASIRMALTVGLDAFERRVTNVATAVRYLHRFQREDDPVRYERALALVRRYSVPAE
ncbi:MAG: hypothetical protein AAB839_01200 [Patescibacteria group bacterium]